MIANVKFGMQRKYLGAVFAALAALGGCDSKHAQTGEPSGEAQGSKVLLLERRLAEIAGEANKASPATIDVNTRLDGAKAGPGLKLTTTYTLLHAEVNGINATTFEARLTPVVREASCTNPELRPLIDQGVVVVLEYLGNDGHLIGAISINRDSCAAPK